MQHYVERQKGERMSDLEFRYYFDPLCGWCYASAPALAALEESYGRQLRMMPTGLFFEPRPITAIADHAWRNDRRIGELTGQRFSESYHHNVLRAPGGVFTSAPLTLALSILGEVDVGLEPRFLHAAQVARYVEGRDTSRIEEVVRVAEAVAAANDAAINAVIFTERLQSDTTLLDRVKARMAIASSELQSLGNGVPQLLVQMGKVVQVVQGEALYGGKDRMLAVISRLTERHWSAV
jgi:putative protein-disulfide isomerase